MSRGRKEYYLTSKEMTAKANPNNTRLVDEFIYYLMNKGRTDKTIRAYRHDLAVVMTYIMNYKLDKDFIRLTEKDIDDMIEWMKLNHQSKDRIQRIMFVLASFCSYLQIVVVDYVSIIDRYKVYKGEKNRLASFMAAINEKKLDWTSEEIEDVLFRMTNLNQYKDACAIALALSCGRTVNILRRFRVDDFGDDRIVHNGTMYRSRPIFNTLKETQECFVLKGFFDPYLRKWMDYREKHKINGDWLLPARDNPEEYVYHTYYKNITDRISKEYGKPFDLKTVRFHFIKNLVNSDVPQDVAVDIIDETSRGMKIQYQYMERKEEQK